MKFKSKMDWKDAVVFFNGFMAKVVDFDGVDKFKISIHKGWIHKDLIVWSQYEKDYYI